MNIKHISILTIIIILFSGCIAGDIVALPFRVTGAVVNTIAPDIIGETITGAGDAIDLAIPF